MLKEHRAIFEKLPIIGKISYTIYGSYPLTLQGTIVLLISTTSLKFFGYDSMDLVIFALAICAIVILIFCLFCVMIGGLIIQKKIRGKIYQENNGDPVSVEVGFPNETGFRVAPIRILPLVKLKWKFIYPDQIETRIRAKKGAALSEEIVPNKRCKINHVIRKFSLSDVLGFCRYSWIQKQTLNFTALPQTSTLSAIPQLRSLNAEDGLSNPSGKPEGDRMEIRRYVPGDSIRDVMWKVYAKTRQLNVRLAEKSVLQDTQTLAYLLSSDQDEAAAAIARMSLETGALGEDWTFGADGCDHPCKDLESALDAVAKSRAIEVPHEYGLDKFLRFATGKSSTYCIIFAAAEIAPWLPKVLDTVSSVSNGFSIVLATDGFTGVKERKIWEDLLFKQDKYSKNRSKSSSPKSDILRLLTELKQRVESVIVIDRQSGQGFDHLLRRIG